jgi:tetratricopeptide (TPR) repeat protein/DNA-binding winged helix-turn-helix (wHTH) protein/TolB-like protein
MLDNLWSAPPTVRLGPYEVDFRSGELKRGGATALLQEQPRKILAILVARAGDVVSREELRQALWPSDTFVDFEHGLNAAIKRLRDALGDSADHPAFIETLPRRGYRLIAPVELLHGAAPTPARREPVQHDRRLALVWLIAAAITIVAVAGLARRFAYARPAGSTAPHIVVLPCRMIAGVEEDRAYCDGLAAMLTSKLASLTTVHRLQVTPASEIRAQRITSASAARQQLGAGLAFEGSVQHLGRSRGINYALVDTSTGSQVDAITFVADVGDGFTSQDQVAEWALAALSRHLGQSGMQAPTQRATSKARAEDFVVSGRGYLQEYHRSGNVDTAIELFRSALQIDPAHAGALAGMGSALWFKYAATRDPAWVPQARDTCAQALAADEKLADAHVCLGTVYSGTGEYAKAVEAFARASKLAPESDAAYRGLADAQEQLGHYTDAEATYNRAVTARPHYWLSRTWLGYFYLTRARFNEAIDQYRQAVALAPDNAQAHAALGAAYVQAGRYEEAITALRQSIAIGPTPTAYANWGVAAYLLRRFAEAISQLEMARALAPNYRRTGNLARACYWNGERDRARDLYEEALEAARKELSVNPRNPDVQLQAAEFLAKLGRTREALAVLEDTHLAGPHERHFAAMTLVQAGEIDRAFALLREAADQGLPQAELSSWIDLDPLRNDPRFAELLKRRMP